MNDLQIDNAVLALAKSAWKKAALIVVETADKLGTEFPGTAEDYGVIASRIEALVRDGRLEARGNTREWRFSEIRRPN